MQSFTSSVKITIQKRLNKCAHSMSYTIFTIFENKANCEQKHIVPTNSISKENPYLKTSKMNYYDSVKYLYQNSPSAHINSFTPPATIRGKLSFSVAQYYSCGIYFLKWLTQVLWWNVMTYFVQIIRGKCTHTNLP